MRRSLLPLFILSLLGIFGVTSCSDDRAVLRISVEELQNKRLTLNMLNVDKLLFVDSVRTNKKGRATFRPEVPYDSPNFYYVNYAGRDIASLIVKPGDRIKIKTDSLGRNIVIEGSEESDLLLSLNDSIIASQRKFDSLSVLLRSYDEIGDAPNTQALSRALGALYVKEKQSALRSIIRNPYSFTNIFLLYRKFSNDLPLFAQENDIIYYSLVRDSLQPLYPASPYVKALDNDVRRYLNYAEFTGKLESAQVSAFPELRLPDASGEIQFLSSLLGHPFILLFWSISETDQRLLNAELQELYTKYHRDKGLEIYSVCIGTDKPSWVKVSKNFEWINVCDGKGTSSPALASYNIQSLPTLFVFDSEGVIVAQDIFDAAALNKVVSKL